MIKVFKLLCIGVVILFFIEIAVRVLQIVPSYRPQPNPAIKLYYDDPNGLVLLRSNATWFFDKNVPVNINSDGYRDKLYTKNKEPGVLRIAVIGDSMTMGDGVYVEDSYPKQLEDLFSQHGINAEVINFGVTATNTLQQVLFLQEKVFCYNPDIIILGFNLDDIGLDKETPFEWHKRVMGVTYLVNDDKTVSILPLKRTFLENIKWEIYQKLAIYRLMYDLKKRYKNIGERIKEKNMVRPKTVNGVTVFPRDWSPERCLQTRNIIINMEKLCSEKKSRFFVAILPDMTGPFLPGTMRNFSQYPFKNYHEQFKKLLDEKKIRNIDTLPFFENKITRELVVSKFDPHFNRKGNAIIASAIFDYINSSSTE